MANRIAAPETPDRLTSTAAVVAAGLYLAVAVFQLALALGAPWGEAAWGGTIDGRLTAGLRIGSALAFVSLLTIAAAVLARAGVLGGVGRRRPGVLRWSTWAITALMALNTVGNLASQSDVERIVFAPVTALLTVLTGLVAHRGPR